MSSTSSSRSRYGKLFKLVVVGQEKTGKSALLARDCENSFSESYLPTIGVDFKIKNTQIEEVPIKMQIWDCAGQDRFQTITLSYYRGAHGIILVYDVTQRSSLERLEGYIADMVQIGKPNVPAVLVGNKIDMAHAREVSSEEGQSLANRFGMGFVETSARSGENVDLLFAKIAHHCDREIASHLRGDWSLQYIMVTAEMCVEGDDGELVAA